MSLTQINDYGIGNVNLTSMMETLDRQRRGYQAVSLTNYDNTSEPKIAAGSIVELGGALFKCEADESITGWAGIGNDEDVYVKLVPSGTTAAAAFTTAAPTWSTSKQGWYVGNDRYIGGLYKDASGNYTEKYLYFLVGVNSVKVFGDGTIKFVGGIVSFVGGIVNFSGADLTADDVATGANINLSADAERTSANTSYNKSKEIVCPFYGVINVYFEIRSNVGDYDVCGRVYKNGAAVGTERKTQSTSYVSYNEDISFAPGDRIQLYIHPDSVADQMRTRNFRLRSNKILGTVLGTILQNTLTTVDTDI